MDGGATAEERALALNDPSVAGLRRAPTMAVLALNKKYRESAWPIFFLTVSSCLSASRISSPLGLAEQTNNKQ